MKKILTTIIFTFSLFCFANATHNVAGEITVKQLLDLQYEAVIHTYTKLSSVPADRDSLQICWGDGNCEYIIRDSFTYIGNDRKYNTYTWQHTYATEGTYTISMTDPNRNGGILNVNAPSSDNVAFHIQTTIVASTFYNTTPELLNTPIDFGYTNEVFQHNPGAVDWEGDSLSYELTIPMSGLDTPVPNYIYPNEIGGGANNIISIDNELGTVYWDSPEIEGSYVITIKIIEHRNGAIISTTHRDFEVTILQGQNPPPLVEVPIDEVTLSVGDTLKFDVLGEDPDMAEIKVEAIGQPFLMDNPPTFNSSSDFSNTPFNESFEWKIFDNHVYLNPYYLVFRIEDKNGNDIGITNYHVVKVNINDSPTNAGDNIFTKEELDVEVFPNPISSNSIFIKLNDELTNEKTTARIMSLDGKLILEKSLLPIKTAQAIDVQAIKNGNYFLIIDSKNKRKTIQIGITNFSK